MFSGSAPTALCSALFTMAVGLLRRLLPVGSATPFSWFTLLRSLNLTGCSKRNAIKEHVIPHQKKIEVLKEKIFFCNLVSGDLISSLNQALCHPTDCLRTWHVVPSRPTLLRHLPSTTSRRRWPCSWRRRLWLLRRIHGRLVARHWWFDWLRRWHAPFGLWSISMTSSRWWKKLWVFCSFGQKGKIDRIEGKSRSVEAVAAAAFFSASFLFLSASFFFPSGFSSESCQG